MKPQTNNVPREFQINTLPIFLIDREVVYESIEVDLELIDVKTGVLMQFREPAAQNWTSTQLQNRGAVRGPKRAARLGW
jgi:hypothetical protein